MYKILELLNRIPEDKRGHINLGMLVGLFFASNMLIAIIAVVSVAVLKEFIDCSTQKGTPELNDALATLLGGAIGLWLLTR